MKVPMFCRRCKRSTVRRPKSALCFLCYWALTHPGGRAVKEKIEKILIPDKPNPPEPKEEAPLSFHEYRNNN